MTIRLKIYNLDLRVLKQMLDLGVIWYFLNFEDEIIFVLQLDNNNQFNIKMIDTALDFLCGCFSGLSQVFFMQPFELVKVRLINQSLKNPQYNGIFDCFRKVTKEEGFMAFYKGSLVPFLGVGIQVAMQFGPNELVKRAMRAIVDDDQEQNDMDPNNNLLTMQLVFLAGILTGIPSSLTVTPIDLTRIILQNQKGDDCKNRYHGSLDAGIQLYKRFGIRGLYQGFYPALLRQVIGLPVYFTSYEKMMRTITGDDGSFQPPAIVSFFVGGFSGMLSWLFSYPVDYVKTVVQSDCPESRKYTSATHCAKVKYREQGIRTFFKGLGVALFRSFPVNGVGFFSFQIAMRLTGRKNSWNEEQQFEQFY